MSFIVTNDGSRIVYADCLGLLSEVNMPIDKFTKKPKGFAFVTFVIPENAVKAYAALDRQSFQVHCFALQVNIASIVIS